MTFRRIFKFLKSSKISPLQANDLADVHATAHFGPNHTLDGKKLEYRNWIIVSYRVTTQCEYYPKD